MSYYNTNLPFSVAKFTIEGAREGVNQIHPICPAPPRLSSPQTASVPKLLFSINPFSLSRSNSLSISHTSVSSSQSSKSANLCTNSRFSSPASVFSISSSSSVHSLFPNPFLAKQKLEFDFQPAPIVAGKSVINSPTPTSLVQPIPNLHNTAIVIPHITTSSPSLTQPRKPRKPRPDRILASSPYRPRVMAVDRLFSWRTPYGISHDESLLAVLPPALVDLAKMSITGAFAVSTRSTYAAGLLRFNQFCDKWHISESTRMPASYALLCAFIGNYKGANSGKTICSWLSGIRAWHLSNHAVWYGDDKWVQMARITANKEGSRHKRPLRAPVSIEHLLALRREIIITNHFHAAVWAVALVTFFGCRRLGETTISSIASFDPTLHVLRSVEYVCLISYILLLIYSLAVVFLSRLCATVHDRRHSIYLGQRQLAKKERLSLSLAVPTNFVLVRPCGTISP